jgi:hypothetical protein
MTEPDDVLLVGYVVTLAVVSWAALSWPWLRNGQITLRGLLALMLMVGLALGGTLFALRLWLR